MCDSFRLVVFWVIVTACATSLIVIVGLVATIVPELLPVLILTTKVSPSSDILSDLATFISEYVLFVVENVPVKVLSVKSSAVVVPTIS